MHSQFIIYACPTGDLHDQLERYFEKSLELYGANAAHSYLPHCTLTGFFKDDVATISTYCELLDHAVMLYRSDRPHPAIAIRAMTFRPDWHGLDLDSDWLKQTMRRFSDTIASSTRLQVLRLKDRLHLSLAYQFAPEQHEPLQALANQLIDSQAAVEWELRFYQRISEQSWTCHQAWTL